MRVNNFKILFQDGNPVSATKKYDISRFNQVALNNLKVSLEQLRSLINNYYYALYDCQMIKEKVRKIHVTYIHTNIYILYKKIILFLFQIDYYLHMLCQPFSTIAADTPVGLFINCDVQSPQGKSLQYPIYDLKSSISILFLYQRKTISDKVFIRETRKLLIKTIGILLKVASWKDHFFILNNVLR